jgi:Probable N6-adenine methyltransferase
VIDRLEVPWFEPRIANEDRFVEPDFGLAQFFYTAETARYLVTALDGYARPCCLCTPRLAWEWNVRGRTVRLLDRDQRFASLPGFRPFDLLRPEPVGERFDVVIVDPVYYPATTLARAMRVLMDPQSETALYISFPVSRESELLSAFGAFGLRPLDAQLTWCNVSAEFQSTFRLYGRTPLPG